MIHKIIPFLFLISSLCAAQTPSPSATPSPASPELPISTGLATSIEYSDEVLDQGLKPKVVILLDSSGSMAELLDGKKSKMYYSKILFASYLKDQWREKANVGMIVYGGRRRHDCSDYFWAFPFGERNLTKIDAMVRKLGPTGMTPIADSLELAIAALKDYPGPKRVMIFTDGVETCGGDSCKILEKAIQEKVFDLEMFVTGIGMEGKSKDLDKLKCLGKTFGAQSPQELSQTLNDISNMIGKGGGSGHSGNNLFVISPDPQAGVHLYKLKNGQKEYFRDFIGSYGVKVPPGDYAAEVILDPVFHFPKFKIPPKKKVTLRVEGKGTMNVDFFENLLDVDILDRNKKVVKNFLSDTPTILKSGVYDIRITGNPFFEQYEKNVKIIPGGKHEIKVTNAGVLQIDHPKVVGFHVYDGTEKEVGNYLTNFPFVLKTGTYRFFINDKCNIDGVNVKFEKSLRRISCEAYKH